MSFSLEIKNELAKIRPSECCLEPYVYGFLLFSRSFSVKRISMQTENRSAAELYCSLLKKVYGVETKVTQGGGKRPTFKAEVVSESDRLRVLASVDFGIYDGFINTEIFSRECCSSSFIRGAFLACGYLADPNKAYRADFPVRDKRLAEELVKLLGEHFIKANISTRGNGYVVYIKKSEMIVNLLTVMGASGRSLEFIETTIMHEIKNKTNRAINCYNKNLEKTIDASIKQRHAIEYLQKTNYLESLPETIQNVAYLRLNNPDLSLKELSKISPEPITVSGLNHRLKKILEIYEELKSKR